MGGATIWPVPRAIDAEAHYYPRRWKRNFAFLYGGMFLIGIQVQRYGLLCRVSYHLFLQRSLCPNSHLYLALAIDDADGRVHGLGQQKRCQESPLRLREQQRDKHQDSSSGPLRPKTLVVI